MPDTNHYALGLAIIAGAWLVGQAIEKGLKQIATNLWSSREQLERIAGNLSVLEGRVNGIYLALQGRR